MNRREVIQSLGLVTTHALFPSILSGFITSCSQSTHEGYMPMFFTQMEFDMVREMIDIIIPATQTKSASQVNAQHFLDEVFAKCMTSEQQALIREGLGSISKDFISSKDKTAILTEIDTRAYQNDEDAAWFKPIKQYALIGFFTSQEGTTKASNYVKIPGDYKGEIPLDDNTLNYGKTDLRFYI